MDSGSDLLIDQLDCLNQVHASFQRVIIHATEQLTRGSGTHDFIHSEAVHQRLSELLPNAHQFGLNEAEISILISSAYLHDIGHSDARSDKRHGEVSAEMISSDDSLKYLFLAGDIKNQVAKVCYYHDCEIAQLEELEKEVKLDIRPCYWIKISQMTARPRLLAAIFRLADELECNSDRMLGQFTKRDDPRIHIAGVRLDLESRSISLDFKHGSTEKNQKECIEHLSRILGELHKFLTPYGSFKIVDKLPESELSDEEEGADIQLGELHDVEENREPIIQTHEGANFEDLIEILQKERMKRVDLALSFLPVRGTTK